MQLKVKTLNLKAGKPIAFIHEEDAKKLQLSLTDRVTIISNKHKAIALVNTIKGFLNPGEVGLSQNLVNFLRIKKDSFVEVEPNERPVSSRIIQSKIKCAPYSKEDLKKIMKDIISNALKDAEIAYFISGVHYCGMSLEETKRLTEAIFETGNKLVWKNSKNVADKHSIGGIPGNRTTPIIVSICAAAGIIMPKTSSRAITSASGTADTVESIAKVDLSLRELKSVVKKTGACLAWGGSLGLAPADDKLIQVEKMINLDPEPQLMASILAKKLAAGSKNVLIDIPYGAGAKVSRKQALRLKRKFSLLGKKLGLKIQVILTDGSKPIGNGIGPILEMKDVLAVLRRENPPLDLERKSVFLAGKIIEMVGKAKKGKGSKLAQEILDSGKAFKKFEEIIKAQHGKIEYLKTARLDHNIKSIKNGKIKSIDNKSINYVARLAGCPADKAAGIFFHKNIGEKVSKEEIIATIYSESERKMREAVNFFNEFKPIKI